MRIFKFFIILVSCISILACSGRKTLTDITFDSSSIITVSERVALIIDPYISFRDTPGPTGITISHGRRGEVFLVIGKKILENNSNTEIWYKSENGWILANSVQLFSSFARAENSAKQLQ